ncbi:hypothetical protein H0X32_02325 [Patescibacteria group bacterium]|nr:hypothetical protein [Patescibacteria group bacterium]
MEAFHSTKTRVAGTCRLVFLHLPAIDDVAFHDHFGRPRKEAFRGIDAAELVDDGLDLAKCQFAVLDCHVSLRTD